MMKKYTDNSRNYQNELIHVIKMVELRLLLCVCKEALYGSLMVIGQVSVARNLSMLIKPHGLDKAKFIKNGDRNVSCM